MKISRTLFLSALLALGASTLPLAQSPVEAQTKQTNAARKGEKQRGPGQGQQRDLLEMMAQYLNLTDSQKTRIKPILEQSMQKSRKVRADKSLTPEQRRKKMLLIRDETQKKIEPILTAEQRKKLNAQIRPAHAKQ